MKNILYILSSVMLLLVSSPGFIQAQAKVKQKQHLKQKTYATATMLNTIDERELEKALLESPAKVIRPNERAAVANDLCEGALPISCGSTVIGSTVSAVNDDACYAIPLSLNAPETVNNFGATAQSGEPSPGPGSEGCFSSDGWCPFEIEVDNSVWYTINILEDGCYEISTQSSNLQIAVYTTGNCSDFNSYSLVAANDDSSPSEGPITPEDPEGPINEGPISPEGPGPDGATPYLNIYLATGTYYIQVDGHNGTLTTDDSIEVSPSTECPLPCEEEAVVLTLNLDEFPSETTWELRGDDGELYGSGGPYLFQDEESGTSTVVEMLCSDERCYEFSIFDSFGDGICCDFGEGSYTISYQGELLHESDGQYGSGETIQFCTNRCLLEGYEESDIGNELSDGIYECIDPDGASITSFAANGHNAPDNVSFLHKTFCGDFTITTKMESVTPNGYGGIMVRETTDPGSKQFSLFSNISNVLLTQIRQTTNGSKAQQLHYRPFPVWIRVQRMGPWLFAYYSPNGVNYQYVQAVFLPLNDCLEVGLATFNGHAPPTIAIFSNINITAGAALSSPGSEPEFPANAQQVVGAADLQIFPNPASTTFTLAFQQALLKEGIATLRSPTGQIIRQRTLIPGDLTTEWDVNDLPAGLYFIEVRQEGLKPQVLRVVKQ